MSCWGLRGSYQSLWKLGGICQSRLELCTSTQRLAEVLVEKLGMEVLVDVEEVGEILWWMQVRGRIEVRTCGKKEGEKEDTENGCINLKGICHA